MFEGPIKAAELAGSEESTILRQLRWSDLVARIAAARDTRPALGELCDHEPHASFAAFHRGTVQQGQHPVNRDALTHGKLRRIMPPEAANNADNGTERHDD